MIRSTLQVALTTMPDWPAAMEDQVAMLYLGFTNAAEWKRLKNSDATFPKPKKHNKFSRQDLDEWLNGNQALSMGDISFGGL